MLPLVKILLFSFLVLTLSCSPIESEKHKTEEKQTWFDIHGCSCYQMSFAGIYQTQGGAYQGHEMISDSSFILKWGKNKESMRIIPDTFYCKNRADMTPSLNDENENYLVTINRCGSECAQYRFLPLNSSLNYYKCNYIFDYDLENHVVAHLDYEGEHEKIKLKNLNTGNIEYCELNPSCSSAMSYYCVDSLSVKDGEFYLRWNPSLVDDKLKMSELRQELP